VNLMCNTNIMHHSTITITMSVTIAQQPPMMIPISVMVTHRFIFMFYAM